MYQPPRFTMPHLLRHPSGRRNNSGVAVACALILLLTSCASRLQTAEDIVRPAGFTQRQIAAAPFSLTVYERIGAPKSPATVYIEGDGLAWLDRFTPSLDPTPTNPVALRLAAADDGKNVIYMARPCQYSKMIAATPCPQEYWTGKRFSPEVIGAMNTALGDIKARYGIDGFNLVGFSGGGAVAALLAAGRDDVLSLRTVAGNIDTAAFTRIHRLSPMTGSLNPADVAATIATVPQHHFIGSDDKIVMQEVTDSFIHASGSSRCIRTTVVPDVSHDKGWAERWTGLLNAPVDCGQ